MYKIYLNQIFYIKFKFNLYLYMFFIYFKVFYIFKLFYNFLGNRVKLEKRVIDCNCLFKYRFKINIFRLCKFRLVVKMMELQNLVLKDEIKIYIFWDYYVD